MRVTVEREVLLTALHRVQGIVEKRNTMPSLANVLLEAKKEGLDISATDLELGMRGLYKATVEEPGSVTFPARKLYEILKEINDQEIAMTVTEDLVTITTARGEFKVVGLPSKDFPPLPAIERDGLIPLPGKGLLQLIRKTLFAVGDNDTRYVLNGLLIVVTSAGGTPMIRLVGTDGHRLALAEQKLEAENKESADAQEEKVIVPKKAAAEIRRLLEEDDDEPMIGFTKNMLIFRKSGLVLTSRLMEGNYPNYQQVIPKASNKQIAVNRDDLEGALRRVSVLSQNKTYAVKLTFSKKAITLFSSHPDMGEANEEIPASFNGEEFSAGFNARYLLDVLSVLESETVVLNMEASLSPCLIREKDNALFQAVVMPVKV